MSGFGAGLSIGKALIEEQACLLNGLLSYTSSLLGSPCEYCVCVCVLALWGKSTHRVTPHCCLSFMHRWTHKAAAVCKISVVLAPKLVCKQAQQAPIVHVLHV